MAKAKAATKNDREPAKADISREDFEKFAKALEVVIDGQRMMAQVKRDKETGEIGFSTGSLGWFLNDKFTVMINGKPVRVQPSISLVVVGSKNKEE